MFQVNHRKFPAPKYAVSYHEAAAICRMYGVSRRCIKEMESKPAEPDLAQMFDAAYEDQCRDACGL